MDRKGQLKNVSFGGAWSEQIAGNEALAEAVRKLEAAASRCGDEDLRQDRDLADALIVATAGHPKRVLMRDAWSRALALPNAGQRAGELHRISGHIRAAVGKRIG